MQGAGLLLLHGGGELSCFKFCFVMSGMAAYYPPLFWGLNMWVCVPARVPLGPSLVKFLLQPLLTFSLSVNLYTVLVAHPTACYCPVCDAWQLWELGCS